MLVLLLPLLASAVYLARLDWPGKVSTNVLDLIPDEAPAPELGLARGIMNSVYADRIMIALQDVSDPEAVQRYREVLEASELVEDVVLLSEESGLGALGRSVFRKRFELLFPSWLAGVPKQVGPEGVADSQALAEYAVSHLESALEQPQMIAFEDLIPSDPLLLLPDALTLFEQVQSQPSARSESDYLLQVKLAVSSMSAKGQVPVFNLLEVALEAGREVAPGMHALDSGANRYAYETEQAVRKEVRWLNVSTFVAVFLICVFLCRRVFLVLHVFVMLAASLLMGVALMMLLYDRMHVFALIFGCVLCGVIVDYGLHAYLHGSGKETRTLRGFLPPFLISCGSTLAGFAILLFSHLPVLQQMGAFVGCGLAVAAVVTLIYTFGILDHDAVAVAWRGARRSPAWLAVLAFTAGLLGLAAFPFLRWQDDIRSLKYPLPYLDQREAELHRMMGRSQQILITAGEDFADLREEVEQLSTWIGGMDPAPSLLNALEFTPRYDDFQQAREFVRSHPDFDRQLMSALDAQGFEPDAFEPFREAWAGYCESMLDRDLDYESEMAALTAILSGAQEGMVGHSDNIYWGVSLLDESVELPDFPEGMKTLRLSQVESLSQVLSGYRHRTLELSLWAALVILVVLLIVLGPKAGALVASVPLFSVSGAATLIDLSPGSPGIFHLIGMFLGACLVLDYAVFTWLGVRRNGEVPLSVLVSGLTTSASFAILAWSKIPAIHALGLTVFLVTACGLGFNYSYLLYRARKGGTHG